MGTANSGIESANKSNPIWFGVGKPPFQVVIASASGPESPSQYRTATTNVDVPFSVTSGNPYPPYIG